MNQPPNILVFLTDDHGQWASRCYGNSELRTPNLDYLAARGVRMTRAFTPCPVCSPARASFWTGRLPSQHGIHDWLQEESVAANDPGLTGQTNLAELLKTAGYHTGLVGKWHCGRERGPHPGFDSWFSHWLNQRPHRGELHFSNHGVPETYEGYQTPCLTNEAARFLRERDFEQPFFLCVGYVDTHSPFKDHPPRLVDSYRTATFRDIPAETFLTCHGRPLVPVPPEHREWLAQYYAAVTMIDEQVGQLLDELDGAGILDNTLVVYTSDHGHMCGHHGLYTKGNGTAPQNFFDESILVPSLLSWPAGLPAGKTCEAFVDHCDLFQTLLQVAGASSPAGLPGRSFLPVIRGESQEWRDAQCCEYGNARMIRTARYKLIRRYPAQGRTWPDELYDLETDPRETQACRDDTVQAELGRRLDEYFARYETPAAAGRLVDQQRVFNEYMPWAVKAE